MEDEIIEAGLNIILPVLKKAGLLAAQYSKACGRSTLTAEDVKYAMMYCARHEVGRQNSELALDSDPDSDSDSDSNDEIDIEMVDESDEPFTRYHGDDELMNKVNYSHDTWESWDPYAPAEKMLKDAINKNMYLV